MLVKAKFKLGARTVAPVELFGEQLSFKPPAVLALDSFYAAGSAPLTCVAIPFPPKADMRDG